MSKAKFLSILIVGAAMSAGAVSGAKAGGYYDDGYYGGGYYAPAYYDSYYRGDYGYGDYGYADYGYGFSPFTWLFSARPPDDDCHQRVKIYDNWGGWVWGQRIVC
jgi:hypothetical protein